MVFDTQPRRLKFNSTLRRRGIYILPNLFTTGALFAGFYAIVQGMNGRFETAAEAIFIAMVLDFLDGRVARMTRTQSAFGAEYDSLHLFVSLRAVSSRCNLSNSRTRRTIHGPDDDFHHTATQSAWHL